MLVNAVKGGDKLMNCEELIAQSNLFFSNGKYDEALKYANQAINSDPQKKEAFICAGKAAMSLSNFDGAIENFQLANNLDGKDGNVYFLLAYAHACSGESVATLKNLTRALEYNCDKDIKGQIYKMMALINAEQKNFQDSLINLKQAEEFVGLDSEILQQKAVCYANVRDYYKTIFTLNQMKLLNPTDYRAYSLAFNIFMELEIFDEALGELERAEKYANLTMAYYNDRIAYTLLHDPANDTKADIEQKWVQTIKAIEEGLIKGMPTAEQVFELYLRAAQLYLSLEQPEYAIRILDAAANPISSFNNGFSVVFEEISDNCDLSFEEVQPEEEEAKMQEKWDNGKFDEIREEINNALLNCISDDSEEIMDEVHKYLSPIDLIPVNNTEKETYTLSGEFKMDSLQYDRRNSLYIVAYELLKDYEAVLRKARELQSSSVRANQYSGIYYELKVGKYKNREKWRQKYKERIRFWTKRMMEDPTDFISASYRIRSYIDIGDFENAEQLCACLPVDVKEPLIAEINKEKEQGGGESGNLY